MTILLVCSWSIIVKIAEPIDISRYTRERSMKKIYQTYALSLIDS